MSASSDQLFKQRLGLFQIERVEAFGELEQIPVDFTHSLHA